MLVCRATGRQSIKEEETEDEEEEEEKEEVTKCRRGLPVWEDHRERIS